MPARSYPAQTLFADPSEKEVWQALIAQLPADTAVVCNLKILDTNKQYELGSIEQDFLFPCKRNNSVY